VRPLHRDGNAERRKVYTEKMRFLAEHYGHLSPTCPYPKELAQLEAGEAIVVQGWQVGIGADAGYDTYCLEADGRLVPVEAVGDPDYPAVKTVRNWQRPDGSLVRPVRS